jgi:hypothetical protein
MKKSVEGLNSRAELVGENQQVKVDREYQMKNRERKK